MRPASRFRWCAPAALLFAPAVCAAADRVPSLTDSGNIFNAIWAIVIFLGLLAVLTPLAWRPILRALKQRAEHIESAIERSEQREARSEELLAEQQAGLGEARTEARVIVEKARADADDVGQEMIGAARLRADEMTRHAEERIAEAQQAAMDEMVTFGADLVTQAARTVIGRELAGEDHQRIIAASLEEIRRREPEGPT